MKACFDTSILVAALLRLHPHHPIAFPRLQAVREKRITGFLTTHALAELFATLTALPLKPRLLPAEARNLIRASILPHFTIIPLGVRDYDTALDMTVASNLPSGAVYDALHLAGARAAGCGALLTLNLRHFQRLAPGDPMVVGP